MSSLAIIHNCICVKISGLHTPFTRHLPSIHTMKRQGAWTYWFFMPFTATRLANHLHSLYNPSSKSQSERLCLNLHTHIHTKTSLKREGESGINMEKDVNGRVKEESTWNYHQKWPFTMSSWLTPWFEITTIKFITHKRLKLLTAIKSFVNILY